MRAWLDHHANGISEPRDDNCLTGAHQYQASRDDECENGIPTTNWRLYRKRRVVFARTRAVVVVAAISMIVSMCMCQINPGHLVAGAGGRRWT